MPVLYDQVTQCLGSLIFSFVSVTSLNDIPTIRGIKFWIAHNRTHPPLGMSELLHLHLFLPKTDWSKFGRCSDTFCRCKQCSWRFSEHNSYCRNNSWLSHQLIELPGPQNSDCKGLYIWWSISYDRTSKWCCRVTIRTWKLPNNAKHSLHMWPISLSLQWYWSWVKLYTRIWKNYSAAVKVC